MDLLELFDIQRHLDNEIIKNHQLYEKNLLAAKILAFQVELGELANETRCFKFWSKKEPSPREEILEEYVDCLHFLLSIGLNKNFILDSIVAGDRKEQDIIQEFHSVFSKASKFYQSLNREDYIGLFKALLSLGRKLGFTEEDIIQAYLLKNQINHQRQVEGY